MSQRLRGQRWGLETLRNKDTKAGTWRDEWRAREEALPRGEKCGGVLSGARVRVKGVEKTGEKIKGGK